MKLNRTALRTIKILEYIANQKDGCTLLEITEALDIPKSSDCRGSKSWEIKI